MYLSAQRVRSSSGDEGVNVHVYSHRGRQLTGMAWDAPDVVRIADHEPGTLVLRVTAVPPGGNHVLSFLDVACADDASAERVADAIQVAVAALPRGPSPKSWNVRGLGMQFFAQPSLSRGEGQELRELKEELLLVLGGIASGPPPASTGPAPPLLVRVERDEIGCHYLLDQGSVDRLLRLGARGVQPPVRVGITHDNRDMLEAFVGDPNVEVAQIVTGLHMDQIDALCGVVFDDSMTGERLWDSRSRSPK